MSIENKIRLTAHTNNDLKIFSYLCQDAIISKDEYYYNKKNKYFVAILSRYCWEKQVPNDQNTSYRVVSGLQFRNIKSIEYINFTTNSNFYNLLAITYSKKNIILNFSMSSKIKLDCKIIDATVEDIDIPWPTKLKPQHK